MSWDTADISPLALGGGPTRCANYKVAFRSRARTAGWHTQAVEFVELSPLSYGTIPDAHSGYGLASRIRADGGVAQTTMHLLVM